MKRHFKGLALVLTCLLLAGLFAGCSLGVSVNSTVMTISGGFAGTRVMTCSAKTGDRSAEVTEILRQSCPEELVMTFYENGGTTTYEFMLTFSNQSDYERKVAAILKRWPKVTFKPPGDSLFVSGFTLTEDFSTTDLFAWALAAAADRDVKISLSEKDAKTTVVLDGVEYPAGNKINIHEVSTPFEKIVVNTDIYGADDYVRSFTIQIKTENYNLMGKENLSSKFMNPILGRISEKGIAYTISYADNADTGLTEIVIQSGHCTLAQLGGLTDAVLPGSTVSFEESSRQPFSISGILSENLLFNGVVCDKNNLTNVELVYNAVDSDTLNDGIQTYREEKYGIPSLEVAVTCNSIYALSGVEASLNVSAAGSVTAGISAYYKDPETSKSAAELAAAYFTEKYPMLEAKAVEAPGGVSMASGGDISDAAPAYLLTLAASGSPGEVSAALGESFGEGNRLEITGNDRFQLYTLSNVKHGVNLTEFCKLANYTGGVGYSFTAPGTGIKNAQLSAAGQATVYDLFDGETLKGSFYQGGIEAQSFEIAYQYQRINIIYLLILLISGLILLAGLGLLTRFILRKIRSRKGMKREELAAMAVQSVALAALPPEQQGDMLELPNELTERKVVVLEPRRDDGLDEDGDESENSWLFGVAMRMLAILSFILFFFNFASVSKDSYFIFTNDKGIAGYDIAYGTMYYGAKLPAYPLAYCLAAVPLVMILLLALRRKLPKFVTSLGVLALAVCQIFFLLSLPSVIEENVEAIRLTVSGYITSPSMSWGYDYSMVMYILLALGAVVLAISEVTELLKAKANEI